jgi:hypothetical protein
MRQQFVQKFGSFNFTKVYNVAMPENNSLVNQRVGLSVWLPEHGSIFPETRE